MDELAIVHIESIAGGGAGVGRLDGMAVFVPRTAPGDDVEVALRRRRRYAEGTARRIVSASPLRVAPPCEHFERDRCGGCQLQHLTYAAQLAAKRDIVRQALRRIGGRDVEVDEVVPSPDEWRYRNKLTLTLRRSGGAWRAGLRPWDAPDELFALVDCRITSERVMAGWREVLASAALLPEAPELRGLVREAGEMLALTIIGGSAWPAAAAFAASCPSFAPIGWEDGAGHTHVIRPGDATQATTFAQVNTRVAARLHDRVATMVEAVAPDRVIDAYAGDGATAGRLVRGGRQVVLIELDRDAVAAARARLGSRARVVAGRVEEHLARLLPADAVILNPPRAGVHEAVCTALEGADPRPRRLVYVSCDPATLARDLARLPSYRLVSTTPFDMFPQTAHVETVCELTPEAP